MIDLQHIGFEEVTFLSLILAASIQIFYFFFFYFRLVFYKPKKDVKHKQPPVSVIITAKNEAENLKKFLPAVLEQDYPNFEVIVVNDGSEDETEIILADLKNKYPNLYFTNISKNEKFTHGKKLALTIGIKAAKNEILLFTDADCQPVSKHWIAKMVRNFDEKTDFVIGYGGYFEQKGLLNKIIRSDTVMIALNYFSFALAGIPYMGVGRNMAYKKSLFFKVKGFAGQLNLLSGSDDLFVNKYANKHNLKTELSKESFTRSIPETKFKNWISQKSRHFTTAKHYKKIHKFLLFLEPFSRILFFISATILLIFKYLPSIVLPVILVRELLVLLIFIKTNKLFNEKHILLTELIYDILQPVLNLIPFINSFFGKKHKIW